MKNIRGQVTVSNNLGLDLEGKISIDRDDKSIVINNLELKSDSTFLMVNGAFHNSGTILATINLSNLDLNQWILGQKNTSISGVLEINGLLKDKRITDLVLSSEIQETTLFKDDFI